MSKREKITLVPRLRFPYFSDEWKKESLSVYLKESRIKGSTGKFAKKLTVKLWGKGVFEKQELLSGSENTQYYYRKKDQFIYSKLDFLNQAFGIIPEYLDGYESTLDLPCFDVNKNLNINFLLEYVQRPTFYKKYGEIADGGRKAKRIQVETFLGFPIYLPTLPEQQKIVDCLSSLDNLIATEERKLSALRNHKKGLMQKLFPIGGKTVPEWRFSEFRDCGEWILDTIGKTCASYSGGTPTTSKKEYYSGNIPFIRSGEIDKGTTELFLTKEGFEKSSAKMVSVGDILVALYGANSGEVALSRINGAINQAVLCLKHKTSNAFVYHYLTHKKNWIIRTYIQGGQGNLSGEIIKSIELFFPRELNEQEKIADCLSSVDELITVQAKKIETLKSHKKGLLQGLFPSIEEVSE